MQIYTNLKRSTRCHFLKKLFSWRIFLIKKHCNRSNIKWEHKQIKEGFDVDPFEGKTDRTETAKVKKTQKQ